MRWMKMVCQHHEACHITALLTSRVYMFVAVCNVFLGAVKGFKYQGYHCETLGIKAKASIKISTGIKWLVRSHSLFEP